MVVVPCISILRYAFIPTHLPRIGKLRKLRFYTQLVSKYKENKCRQAKKNNVTINCKMSEIKMFAILSNLTTSC